MGAKSYVDIISRKRADRPIWAMICLIWSMRGVEAGGGATGSMDLRRLKPSRSWTSCPVRGFPSIAGGEAGTPHPLLKIGQGKLLPYLSLGEAKASDFDMIVMPGGRKGTPPLQNAPRVARLLRSFKAVRQAVHRRHLCSPDGAGRSWYACSVEQGALAKV